MNRVQRYPSSMFENKSLVDDEVVAKALQIPVVQVGKLRRARKIPFVRLGHRTIRFDLAQVMKAVQRFEIKEVV
jgi:hypothetical protein